LAVRVRCPNSQTLSVKDELAGKRVRCPKCKTLFRADEIGDEEPAKRSSKPPAPAASAAADPNQAKDDDRPKRRTTYADDDDDDGASSVSPEERRKNRQRDKKKRLRQVNIGLLIHIVGLWTMVVLIFFIFLWRVFGVAIDAGTAPGLEMDAKLGSESVEMFKSVIGVCQILILILVAVVPIANVAGSGFCSLIPKKSEARGTIVTSLVFSVIPLIASVLIPLAAFNVFDTDKTKNERLLNLLVAGSVFFSVASLILFMLFLRQLASYVQKMTLASEALNLVSWLMIMAGAAPIVLVGMGYLAPIVVGMVGGVLNIAVLFLLTLGWFGTFYYMFFQPVLCLSNGLRAAIAAVT
jgi:hypothetical protein